MYTVLLVDDERSVIDSLKSEIPWENLGVKTIYTASDGLQALDLIHAHSIDLLITDIRMPRMDGLELLSALRSDNSQVHCILLTAYGEFEYAKQAFSLGVENYLLKPMQTQELMQSVENALENLYANRKNRSDLFRENILRRWLLGNISSDELGEKTIYLDINIYQKEYCILAMKKTDHSFLLHPLSSAILLPLSNQLEYCDVWDNAGHYLILIGARKIPYEQLKLSVKNAIQSFDERCLPRIALGSIVTDRMNLHSSYGQACTLSDLSDQPEIPFQVLTVDTQQSISPKKDSDINLDSLSPIVSRTIQYIEAHYSEGVSLKEFCAAKNLNAAYVGYLFKKETGTFFNHYLTDFRTKKAVELLCNTGTKISDIGELTGYTTTSHFITTFKKKTGFSPLKYRELHGGNDHDN